jgi:bacteriorhodopsin
MSVDGTLIYLSIGAAISLLLELFGFIEKARALLLARGVPRPGRILVFSIGMSIVLWPMYPIVFVLGLLVGIIQGVVQAVRGQR